MWLDSQKRMPLGPHKEGMCALPLSPDRKTHPTPRRQSITYKANARAFPKIRYVTNMFSILLSSQFFLLLLLLFLFCLLFLLLFLLTLYFFCSGFSGLPKLHDHSNLNASRSAPGKHFVTNGKEEKTPEARFLHEKNVLGTQPPSNTKEGEKRMWASNTPNSRTFHEPIPKASTQREYFTHARTHTRTHRQALTWTHMLTGAHVCTCTHAGTAHPFSKIWKQQLLVNLRNWFLWIRKIK